MSTLAFMCGAYNKTTDLAFHETEDKICCVDVSEDCEQTIISKSKSLTFKDNRVPDDKKDSGHLSDLNKTQSTFTCIRYDLFSRIWAVDVQGTFHLSDYSFNDGKATNGNKKQLSNLQQIETAEKPMVQGTLR